MVKQKKLPPRKKKIVQETQEDFLVRIRCGDDIKEAKGNSPLEAILKIVPEKTNLKAVISVYYGNKVWELGHKRMFLHRLLHNTTLQQILNAQSKLILTGKK